VWKISNWTASSKISMIPSQKFGVLMPPRENIVAP